MNVRNNTMNLGERRKALCRVGHNELWVVANDITQATQVGQNAHIQLKYTHCRWKWIVIYDLSLQTAITITGFPLYVGIEIQGFFKDFQGPWNCIFKDKFSTEVYSTNSITAIFNICLCDYGTVLVDKNKTWQLLANLVLGKIPA